MRRSLIPILLLTGILRAAEWRVGLVGDLTPGLEASSIGSGELFGIADAGFYPPGEFLQTGLFARCLYLMMKLPPFGWAGVSVIGVEVWLPPKVVRADVPILRGELKDDGLYIVVVGETAAEEMARKLGEN